MASPITANDIPEYSSQADVCDKLELLLRTSDRFRDFLEYAFTSSGGVSEEFADDIVNAIGSLIGVPTGAIIFRPVTTIPSGYVLANGQSLSRTDYPELFLVYGTNFGADSSLTFKVPNLYDRFLLGGGSSYPVTSTGGSATHTLTESELPAHSHDFQYRIFEYQRNDDGPGGDPNCSIDNVHSPGKTPFMDGTEEVGGGAEHNNLPPYFAGLWLVKT